MKKLSKIKLQFNDFVKILERIFIKSTGKLISLCDLRKKISKNIGDGSMLVSAVNFLEKNKVISKVGKDKFKLSLKKSKDIIGRVDRVNLHSAYIVQDANDLKDIYVAAEDLNGALHNDKVKVKISKASLERPIGVVESVLERESCKIVCVIKRHLGDVVGVPVNRKYFDNIFITSSVCEDDLEKKALVEVVEWEKKSKKFLGKVVSVFGIPGENNAEIHSIVAEFGFDREFPIEVVEEANQISRKNYSNHIKDRRDFRDVLTFTIDPHNAKDFDDALSFKKLDENKYQIGIHIADVSHYLKKGSFMDIDAYQRGCSVYLVDRTIPMLPEVLSNELCSLRPNEEKFTLSVVVDIDNEGVIDNVWFGEAIILSKKRFTYEEAQKSIEDADREYGFELNTLNKLAKILKSERQMSGAIDFDQQEVYFDLDENGKPLRVLPKIVLDAHKLIEEFMVLANRKVAEFIYHVKGKRSGLVSRVHDKPNDEKLQQLFEFASQFKEIKIKKSSKTSTQESINSLISTVHGTPQQSIINTMAVRSMARALYSCKSHGHYGLGLKHYAHFTSPIRRYPDVMVHRLLKSLLESEKEIFTIEKIENECKHLSSREYNAASAERASIRYKQAEYLESLGDRVWDAMITDLGEWGIFCEIVENKCEGTVLVDSIKGDKYVYDKKNNEVVGKKFQKHYKIGEMLKVKLSKVDMIQRRVYLEIVNE